MLIISLFTTLLAAGAALSQPIGFAVDVESLIELQRSRAGMTPVFTPVDDEVFITAKEIATEEMVDYKFLLAYMPLYDIASIDGAQLFEDVRLAGQIRTRFRWSDKVTDELYRHFVLPHRIAQEPYVHGWRKQFFLELTPRIEGMSMTDAALEVNHWCHERATFKQTSGRDQDPLTTIRAGYGRCEEEMILTIAAMRSIGIPARQCYTPYWPHTDNNHAWVEVWTDGSWKYLGACEPAPELNLAWFTEAASRAMVVVSTAYGDYYGDEPVLNRYGASTLINSTAVYGNARSFEVQLFGSDMLPAANQKLYFNLFNYGALMPALSLITDETGRCRLTCGRGGWMVSAASGGGTMVGYGSTRTAGAVYPIADSTDISRPLFINYTPPVKPHIATPKPPNAAFKRRLAREDSIRDNHTWQVWAFEAGIRADIKRPLRPDYVPKMKSDDADRILKLLERSRGNWGSLHQFLIGGYPMKSSEGKTTVSKLDPVRLDQREARITLLETLTDKDLVDFTPAALEDHFLNSTIELSLAAPAWATSFVALDGEAKQRYLDYVIAPRIDWEPSRGWRGALVEFLRENPKLARSSDDAGLTTWLRENIAIEAEKDRLGPNPAPDIALKLRRGTEADALRLYIGFCRVRGIPARIDPVSGRPEKWNGERWEELSLYMAGAGQIRDSKKGFLHISAAVDDTAAFQAKYMKDWAVQEWTDGHGSLVDFGWEVPFEDMIWPRELPPGRYSLTTGRRRVDGSAPVLLKWFDVVPGKDTRLEFEFRDTVYLGASW